MKKNLLGMIVGAVLGISTASHAELFNRGGGLIYDSDNNITWLADANYAKTSGFTADGTMTWFQANAWAANLTYGGYSDWRLPTTCFDCWPNNSDEMNNLYKELGGVSAGKISDHHNSQYDLFQNIQSSSFFTSYYWTNQEIPYDKSYAATYTFSLGTGLGWDKDDNYYAWPVRPGDSAATGFTPQNPILPTTSSASGWQFDLTIPNELLYIDPQVAVGYDYLLDSGPNFTSVLLPSAGDNQFSLYLWNGSEWTFDSTLNAGIEHAFTGAGVDRFRITGIETSAGLDPNSPTAFVTGLTFSDTGHASMHMNPLVQAVPEPETYAMLIVGLGLLGWRIHKPKS